MSDSDTLLRLKDRYDNNLVFRNGGDVWVPIYPDVPDYRQHLKQLRHAGLRRDDVIVTGYPRSGNNWHHQIMYMLLKGKTDYEGYFLDDLMDMVPVNKWPPLDKPRVFVSHLRFHHLPQQVREKQVKVIYLYRNPKDTWVSWYNLMQAINKGLHSFRGTWPQFFDLMMDMGMWYGDWFDHILDWEKEMADYPNILPSCYELMKRDPVGQIMKIDQFLGLNRGRALCEQIAKACEFSTLKAAKDAQIPEDKKKIWEEGVSGLYRKGEIGDWKNWFTVAQNERFDAEFEKRMSESKLPFIFQ